MEDLEATGRLPAASASGKQVWLRVDY